VDKTAPRLSEMVNSKLQITSKPEEKKAEVKKKDDQVIDKLTGPKQYTGHIKSVFDGEAKVKESRKSR